MHALRGNRKMLLVVAAVFLMAPLFAEDQVAWVKDYDAALKQASKEKKFIVLDISASW